MLEEFKELVQLLNNLPHLALWVAAGFWAYKVIVIGSIYGLIRFAIDKLHDWLTKPKAVEWKFASVRLHEPEKLEALLRGVASYSNSGSPNYTPELFYTDSMRHLQAAWNDYTAKNPSTKK